MRSLRLLLPKRALPARIDEMMQQWIDEADIQTTDAYDEITYDNTQGLSAG